MKHVSCSLVRIFPLPSKHDIVEPLPTLFPPHLMKELYPFKNCLEKEIGLQHHPPPKLVGLDKELQNQLENYNLEILNMIDKTFDAYEC